MGIKLVTEDYIKERESKRKKKEKERLKYEGRARRLNKFIEIISSKAFKVVICCFGIFLVAVVAKDVKISNQKYIDGTIDWDSLTVSKDDLDTTGIEKIEGTIGWDAYYELRKNQEMDNIEQARPIMTAKMYNNLMDGLESKYFYDSIQADYNDICTGISDLVTQSEYINALYSAYEKDVGLKNYETDQCLGLDDNTKECELKSLIDQCTQGDLKKYLMDAHDKWETLTNYRKSLVTVTEGYTDLLYQDTIVTDLSTIRALDGEIYAVGYDMYNKGADKAVKNIEAGKLEQIRFNQNTSINALDQLTLYNSIDFFDTEFASITSNTITALFAGDAVVDNEQYLGENLSQEEIIAKLNGTSGDGSKSDVNVATDSNVSVNDDSIDGYVPIKYSLTGRDDRDAYYLFFKIDNCEHDMNKVETYKSMSERLNERAEAIEAQKDISAIITAEIENLDIKDADDIKAYFKNFTISDEEAEENAKINAENGTVTEKVVGATESEIHDHEY